MHVAYIERESIISTVPRPCEYSTDSQNDECIDIHQEDLIDQEESDGAATWPSLDDLDLHWKDFF
jgi:hypothetical protein